MDLSCPSCHQDYCFPNKRYLLHYDDYDYHTLPRYL